MAEIKGSSEHEIVIPIHRPASREKFFFLISGIISSIPLTLFVSQFEDSLTASLTPLYALLVSSVIVAPFLEEFAKAFPLFYRHGETQRSIFTLGLFVGFGFGIIEFILYVFLLGIPFFFRIPGVLFHTASTSITAYGIATKRTFMFYLVAVGLHFSNNLIAFAQFSSESLVLFSLLYLGVFVVMFLALLSSWLLYRKTTEKMIPYK